MSLLKEINNSDSHYQEQQNKDTIPVRSLWVEVLTRALLDATYGSNAFSRNYESGDEDTISEETKKVARKAQNQAVKWIFSNNTKPQSFLWICDSLLLPAKAIRISVLETIDPSFTRDAGSLLRTSRRRVR